MNGMKEVDHLFYRRQDNTDIRLHFTLTLIISRALPLILHTCLSENQLKTGNFLTILKFKMLDFFFFTEEEKIN